MTQLCSVPEASRELGIGKSLCWEKIYAGEIKTVRVGRRRLVPRVELDRYVAQLCAEAGIEPARTVAAARRRGGRSERS